MADEELHLIGPDDIAYRLELTPAQLKVTFTALKSFLDDFGHDEPDVRAAVREVLEKLPDEHSDPLDRHLARALAAPPASLHSGAWSATSHGAG